MAVTAKFLADFSSFNSAVEKAVVTARKFETGIEKVESSLNRMSDSFSGRQLIQQATLAARAVDEIGGTSKLTKDELERLGNMAAQAVTKMKAIGETAPKRLEDLARHAKSSTKELDLMSTVLGKIGPQIAAAFSVGAVISFAKGITSFASEMVDLSAETGISTDRLQALNYVAAGAGLTIQDIAGGVNQLSRRLAGDDDSAAAAVDRLGLNIVQLQGQNPDEVFLSIARAMTKLDDAQVRVLTSGQLFGTKAGPRMLRIMTEDLDELIAKAETSGAVIDKEMIQKANEVEAAWNQMIISLKGQVVSFVATVTKSWEEFDKKRLANAGKTYAPQASATQVGSRLFDAGMAAYGLTQPLVLPTAKGAPGIGGALPTMFPPNDMAAIAKKSEAIARANAAAAAGHEAQARAARAAAAEVERLDEEYKKWIITARNSEGEARIAALAAKFSDIQSAVEAGLMSIQGFAGNMAKVGSIAETAALDLTKAENALYGVAQAMESAGDSAGVGGGGGGIFGSLFGGMKGGLSGLLQTFTGGKGISGIFSKIGTGLFEGFGNILSGGLSSLINSGIGLLGKGISKLFGGGEHSKVNDMRDAYIASAGGITKLAEEAQKAGTSVDKLLGAKKVKDFQNAVAELDTQLEDFTEKQKEAEQAAEERLSRMLGAVSQYGIQLADVSAEVRDKVLGDQAEGLLTDWEALAEAGVNIATIQDKMKESILAYIDTAMKAGADIPESFRPMLEAILLTADYADAAALSLMSMGELAAAGMRLATQEVERFNATLARNTYGANNNSPTQGGSIDFNPKMFDPATGSWITPTLGSWQGAGNQGGTEEQFRRAFNLDVISAGRAAGYSEEYMNKWAQANNGDISRFGRAHNLPGFYGGTGGRYLNFGAGTPAMLHGRERVSTEAEGRAEASGFSALAASMDAMRRDFSTFPELMRDALQTRVVVAH